MPVPKKRHSRSRQGKRRAESFRATLPNLAKCPSCGEPVLPHNACLSCGTYKGRAVIKIKQPKKKGKE
ncbi:50S ribosomal protein L32 [candidate division WOR-1 bacterium RIFOXYA2_FULL_36_21]|uniref:Large ribosomal subunit protein bL32 n=1 Tax=candidate division WOR-1 bacterium RIFOXYB2_FULL_36_35 TaxID=1802578 RepID=A0A1F4RYT4_UNCSA|nr:MAG: 50S ribosomal protein L32 [candidate division WOR-1 bacterium RIFOXYA2_FULL_36_21]OGC13342.1 MAG: 50S ribosomal protein L32 [candidate division WOR-1 bacterium RIFOXYB2_FULL_36_35]OGC14886.1 MAG: 50S ribosomal protein L32 [candidate division WOR-1 bacterium RIFOXYA12_FULL_36_13]